MTSKDTDSLMSLRWLKQGNRGPGFAMTCSLGAEAV